MSFSFNYIAVQLYDLIEKKVILRLYNRRAKNWNMHHVQLDFDKLVDQIDFIENLDN